jgi:hypothetical protein
MASNQSVPDEAACNNPNLLAHRSGSEVFGSQSRKWLTERFAYLPQVRLVFGEKLPQFVGLNEKFEEP